MKNRAFTLVEIMIVCAIIALLGAMNIPNLIRTRLAANEAAAISALKTISSASHTYRASNPGYPADLNTLYANLTPPYIDKVLAGGIKDGYNFTLEGTSQDVNGNFQGFLAQASPLTIGFTGNRYFSCDTSGVIRYGLTANASVTGTPID
jgi:type IV pilus assembly protein PilA